VTLLDAYALVAFLVGGPATPQVRAILREGDAAVATANLAEALDVSQRVYGLPVLRAVEIIEPLFDGALTAISLDFDVARRGDPSQALPRLVSTDLTGRRRADRLRAARRPDRYGRCRRPGRGGCRGAWVGRVARTGMSRMDVSAA